MPEGKQAFQSLLRNFSRNPEAKKAKAYRTKLRIPRQAGTTVRLAEKTSKKRTLQLQAHYSAIIAGWKR